jgi:hypothetical protein
MNPKKFLLEFLGENVHTREDDVAKDDLMKCIRPVSPTDEKAHDRKCKGYIDNVLQTRRRLSSDRHSEAMQQLKVFQGILKERGYSIGSSRVSVCTIEGADSQGNLPGSVPLVSMDDVSVRCWIIYGFLKGMWSWCKAFR